MMSITLETKVKNHLTHCILCFIVKVLTGKTREFPCLTASLTSNFKIQWGENKLRTVMHMTEFTRAMVLTTGTIQSTRTQSENSKLVANISYLSSRNSSGSQKASGDQYQSHKSVPSSVPFFNNIHPHQQMRQIKPPCGPPVCPSISATSTPYLQQTPLLGFFPQPCNLTF